jgi:hypothetical protein
LSGAHLFQGFGLTLRKRLRGIWCGNEAEPQNARAGEKRLLIGPFGPHNLRMELWKECPKCREKISVLHEKCPDCGRPLKLKMTDFARSKRREEGKPGPLAV